ncbi:MAG: DNA modification methylase [Patescibacteria group bacterium]|jgi:DNA modification methylase
MEKLIWHTEKRRVRDLHLYKDNPRYITENQQKILVKGLTIYNLVEIPAIDTDNIVLAGNQRIKVLVQLGRADEEIEVRVPNRKLTEQEFKDYNLRSNANSGDWDWEILKSYAPEDLIRAGLDDIDLSKYWDSELGVEDDHFNLDKAIKEVAHNPVSKVGDMFQLGPHRVVCGDNGDPLVLKHLAENNKVSFINSDPPFGIGLNYSRGVGNKSNYGGQEKDQRTEDEQRQLLEASLKNALSVASPDTHVFYWSDEKYVGLTQQLFRDFKIENKRLCIWIKNNQSVTAKTAFNKMTEYCIYGTRGKPFLNDTVRNLTEIQNKEISSGNRAIDDIMDMLNIWLVDRLPATEYQHPTMKPPPLYEKAMRRCTKVDDYILDCFAGSGSQLIAAEQLKRRALLVEIDPVFVDLILLRYEQLTGTKPARLN